MKEPLLFLPPLENPRWGLPPLGGGGHAQGHLVLCNLAATDGMNGRQAPSVWVVVAQKSGTQVSLVVEVMTDGKFQNVGTQRE